MCNLKYINTRVARIIEAKLKYIGEISLNTPHALIPDSLINQRLFQGVFNMIYYYYYYYSYYSLGQGLPPPKAR